MGRSSGGGSRSGGSFGGGRSSGGFSSGGRSSSSRGASSRSSSPRGYSPRGHGSHRNHIPPPRRRPVGGPRFFGRPRFFGGPHFYGPRPPRRRSPFIGLLTILIILFICTMLFISFFSISSVKSPVSQTEIKNTTERTPLSGVVTKTDWYDDQIGWISSPNQLISGLEDFYNLTGVQPYVMLIPYSETYWNGDTLNTSAADTYLNEIYDSHFSDEGHFIFAYFACLNDVESEMDGEIRYLSGYAADTIMDNEACNILEGYYQINYYDTSLSTEQFIGNTFRETAQSIMSNPTNVWNFLKIAIVVIGVVAVIGIIYAIFKAKAKREREKEEYTKEILDKPLETFGDDTSDLEEKYK